MECFSSLNASEMNLLLQQGASVTITRMLGNCRCWDAKIQGTVLT